MYETFRTSLSTSFGKVFLLGFFLKLKKKKSFVIENILPETNSLFLWLVCLYQIIRFTTKVGSNL